MLAGLAFSSSGTVDIPMLITVPLSIILAVPALYTLWSVALAARSGPALAGALFQHACIWVHWYCTEAPDMDVIYGK